MSSKDPLNFKLTDKKHITSTMSFKPVFMTFTLIVLLFYSNGITETSLAQLSTTSITPNNATVTNDSSNNSKCFKSSPIINTISILKVNVLPPKIVMNYGGREYQGEEVQRRGNN